VTMKNLSLLLLVNLAHKKAGYSQGLLLDRSFSDV